MTDPIVRLDAETFLVRSTPRWTVVRYKHSPNGGFDESSEEIVSKEVGVTLRFDFAERLSVWHDGTALFDTGGRELREWREGHTYFFRCTATREYDSDSEDDCMSAEEWQAKETGQMQLKNELKALVTKVWGEDVSEVRYAEWR